MLTLMLFGSNLLLLLLWLRLWRFGSSEFTFNPLLSGPMRLADAIVEFLRPVLIGLRPRAVAAATLFFLLIFRGVVLCRAGSGWEITLGMTYGRALPGGDWFGSVIFSFTDFFGLLIRLWGLGLLVSFMTPVARHDRFSEAFAQFTRPFSLLSPVTRVALLLLLHGLFVLQLQRTGTPLAGVGAGGANLLPLVLNWHSPATALLQLVWMTALSLAEVFRYAYGAMMGVVLANLVAALMGNGGMQQLLREAFAFLLGGFGQRPLRIGMLDLTPLAYFFVMNILYALVCGVLRTLLSFAAAT